MWVALFAALAAQMTRALAGRDLVSLDTLLLTCAAGQEQVCTTFWDPLAKHFLTNACRDNRKPLYIEWAPSPGAGTGSCDSHVLSLNGSSLSHDSRP